MVMLFWGSMGIPSTYAVGQFSPMTVLCLRSGIGAMVLLPVVLRRCGSIRPAREERGLLLLLALVGVVACNYLYFLSVQQTSLTHVAVLYALGPIMTTVLAAVFLREHVHLGRGVGIVLAFGGVFALLTKGDPASFFQTGFNRGDAAELLSSLCLAVYTILSKKLRRTPAECVTFWLMAISFAVTLPVVLLGKGAAAFRGDARGWLSVLYLGILCSGLGYLLQQRSIKLIGASASAAFLNGISPITILTAAVILHEVITGQQVLCMILVFCGLVLNARNRPGHPLVSTAEKALHGQK